MSIFPHIFSPIQIGNMTVKNRLMMSAMSINFGVDERCHVTDQLTQYFVERAKGGVGMMLVGGGSVHPGGQELPDLPVMYEDSCISSLKKMVAAVKEVEVLNEVQTAKKVEAIKKVDELPLNSDNKVKFGVQLMHGGRQSYLPQKVAPSAIPAPAVVKGEVRALEVNEIKELAQCFGNASKRCKDAGFDFVEIHAAHGYLINQFMSPNSNIRGDQYGGTFENRTRFLFEIIEDIKQKTGDDFPVGIRINGRDYIKNGWEIEDAVKLAPLLEKAGVAYLHISGGVYGSTELTIPSMYSAHGCFVHLAAEVKKHVSIPVITVGRIKSPVLADEILKEGKADMVSMGRALLADPYLPLKAQQNRLSEIRPCIGCCLGCIHAVLAKEPGSCVVNPDVGREYKLNKTYHEELHNKTYHEELQNKTYHEELHSKTYHEELQKRYFDKKLKILVVGAGPSGMASARIFAMKGHQVIIVEQKHHSGGLLSLAAKAPGRGELNDILEFLRNELVRLNVEIKYNTPLDEKILTSFDPDKVIVATGSMPDMPMIKGLFQSDMEIITNVDILEADSEQFSEQSGKSSLTKKITPSIKSELSDKKVIVLGGGMAGLITADYIASKGNEVWVLNRKKSFAEEMSANDRYYLRENLKKKGVILYKNVAVERFTARGVEFHVIGKVESFKNQSTKGESAKGESIKGESIKGESAKGQSAKGESIKGESIKGESIQIDGCDMVVISEKNISIRDMKKFEAITRAEFHFIGDAKSPRHLMYCISEAQEFC